MLEYAPLGIIGILTPQANTTVEPEFSILCPPGISLLTARLTSKKNSMDDRLVDYVISMEKTLDRFANAPLSAVAFACTGAAYLVEPEEENAKLNEIQNLRGYPVITAANAVADALKLLNAKKVGIVSPYGDLLHKRALRYWTNRGVEILAVHRIKNTDNGFHQIYSLSANASEKGLGELNVTSAEAIVMLGTGLPTLSTLMLTKYTETPIISPNLCLMWRTYTSIMLKTPSLENLLPWVSGNIWRNRYKASILSS